ncbi:hypothetical protein DFQ29_008957 [Apophysomyces sp. BC1021]|nr:hypothetical protein DFQ29_008957 [Apophysomyces sp. BC1021]
MDKTPANDTCLIGITRKPRKQSLYQQRLQCSKDTTSNQIQTAHTLDTINGEIRKLEKERENVSKAIHDERTRAQQKDSDKSNRSFLSRDTATHAVHQIQDALATARSTRCNLDLDLSNMIITGTDYGVASLATTVAHIVEQLQSIKDGKFVRLARPTMTRAKDIQWKGGQYRFSKKPEHTKKNTDAGQRAETTEKTVGENTIYHAKDTVDLVERYSKIRAQGPTLRQFYGAKWIRRNQRWLLWHKKQILNKMIVKEQRDNNKPMIRAIGHARTRWERESKVI